MTYYLNDHWYFCPSFDHSFLNKDQADLGPDFEPVRLPHTVKELPLNYLKEEDYQLVSTYVTYLTTQEDWIDQVVSVTFGAVAHQAQVYLNGHLLGQHASGYTAFSFDLAPYLKPVGQTNQLLVRVDSRESLNQPPFGFAIDYLTYGGIYRSVTLDILPPYHLGDLFVSGDAQGQTQVQVQGPHASNHRLAGRLLDADGCLLASLDPMPWTQTFRFAYPSAQAWSPESPVLYYLELDLLDGEIPLHTKRVRFGYRTMAFQADGFYLNGAKYKLRGLNRHQSWPYMGYAAPDRAQALDADLLKYELSCNAVRTSHYPQSHAFIDRCDEIGLLVFTEIPGWQHIGDQEWQDQALANVREMVVEYRNHPSIFLWGVRINESQDHEALYLKTNALAHQLDPSRATGGVRYIKKSQLLEDVYTYNDFSHIGTNPGVEGKKAVTPDLKKAYLVTEYNGHMFPTKSYDWEGKRVDHALRHHRVLEDVAGQEDIAGSFGWCMFDYNTHQDFGSGDRVCYHGVMDIFRNPKLAAAVYASQTDSRPVLEISSHMNIGDHPMGSLGKVMAFTNMDTIKLYKNDVYVGTYTKPQSPLAHPAIDVSDTIGDLLVTQEGMKPRQAEAMKKLLFAIAKYGQNNLPKTYVALGASLLAQGFSFDRIGQLYGTYIASWGEKATSWRFEGYQGGEKRAEVIKEPVQELHLDIAIDSLDLVEGASWDMATVRARVLDQNNQVLPYFVGSLEIEVQGPLAIIGPSQPSFAGGMTGTYLKTLGQAGQAKVTFKVPGLEPVEKMLTIRLGQDKEQCL